MTSVNAGNLNLISYTYDENGNKTGINYGNGQSENLVYDENSGMLKSFKSKWRVSLWFRKR